MVDNIGKSKRSRLQRNGFVPASNIRNKQQVLRMGFLLFLGNVLPVTELFALLYMTYIAAILNFKLLVKSNMSLAAPVCGQKLYPVGLVVLLQRILLLNAKYENFVLKSKRVFGFS